jgi:hypothetical protein
MIALPTAVTKEKQSTVQAANQKQPRLDWRGRNFCGLPLRLLSR